MNKALLETLAYREHQLRPLLLKCLGPQRFIGLYSLARPQLIKMLSELKFKAEVPDRPYQQWGLTFRNDIGNAAGLDKDGLLLNFNYQCGAGFALVGTVLHKPHSGNLYPFMGKQLNMWTPLPHSQSAINSLGLPGQGIEPVLKRIETFKANHRDSHFPIGLSVMGHPKEEGEEKILGVESCLRQSLKLVDFIEINESCPNVQHHDHSALEQRIERFCRLRDSLAPECPLWFKFAQCPSADTIQALDHHGVQAMVLTNTQIDYPELYKTLAPGDQNLFKDYTSSYKGGLSGKIIQATSKHEIETAKAIIECLQLELKLIHVGGLRSKDDMQDSRTLTPLREWYSGFMEAMATLPFEYIYPSLF